MQIGPHRPGIESPEPSGKQRPGKPGQNITAAGGGQPRGTSGIDPHQPPPAPGGTPTPGNQGRGPLQKNGRGEPAGQLPHSGEPFRLHLLPGNPQQRGGLSRMRREQSRRAPPPNGLRIGEPQPIGVDQNGHIGRHDIREPGRVITKAGPDHPRLHAPRLPGRALGHQSLREPRDDGAGRRPDVPNGPGPTPQGPGHGKHGGAGIPGGPGDDAHDTAPVLVALTGGLRQQPGHVIVLKGLQIPLAGNRFKPNVDKPNGTGVLPPGINKKPRLVRTKGDGHISADGLPVDLPRIGVDAAGQIHRNDNGTRIQGSTDNRQSTRTKPTPPPNAHDPVDNEIGPGKNPFTAVGDAPPGGKEGGKPGTVHPLGVQKHGGNPGATTGKPGTGVEGVTPVVPGPDKEHDPGPVHLAEELGADDGEPGGGTLHQGAFGKSRHEGTLGGPYGVHAVGSTHKTESPAKKNPAREAHTQTGTGPKTEAGPEAGTKPPSPCLRAPTPRRSQQQTQSRHHD